MNRILKAVPLFLLIAVLFASAQTRRKTRTVENPQNATIQAAEAARDQQDYAKAEALLKEALKSEPQNYYAWFDLGTVYSASNRTQDAIDAFRKSVAANPDVIESNLNLALLLAQSGAPEAGKYLRNSAKLKPNASQVAVMKSAWIVLARSLAPNDRAGAIDAYEQAAALDPKDAIPHVELGVLYDTAHSDADAEREFKAALALDPSSTAALASISNLYLRTKRLAEAEAMLRQFLQVQPQSANGHLQLGRVLAANARHDDAIPEFERALELSPGDVEATRELAESQYQSKRYPAAVASLKVLTAKVPNDAQLHFALGRAALHTADYQLALSESLTAAKLKPDFAEAYGQAAMAASEQKDYPLALKALDYRTKFLPESPATLFLRATCLDHLRAYPEASQYYKKFLVEAKGRFPDEEWKARHRLIAIDPESRKNK
jgi:tetratricopeptide (TPR) repeat protein